MRPFTEVDHILINIFLKEILFTTETSNARSSQVGSANRRNKWHRTQSSPIKSHDHHGPIKYWSLWTQLKCWQYLTIFLGFPWALLGGLVTYTNALTSSHVWLHQLLSRVSMLWHRRTSRVEIKRDNTDTQQVVGVWVCVCVTGHMRWFILEMKSGDSKSLGQYIMYTVFGKGFSAPGESAAALAIKKATSGGLANQTDQAEYKRKSRFRLN